MFHSEFYSEEDHLTPEEQAELVAARLVGHRTVKDIANSWGTWDVSRKGKPPPGFRAVYPPAGHIADPAKLQIALEGACLKLKIPYIKQVVGFERIPPTSVNYTSGKARYTPKFEGVVVSLVDAKRLARHLHEAGAGTQLFLPKLKCKPRTP